jgi:hypothetical protein
MKRSELKKIIQEVIEESKLHEEAVSLRRAPHLMNPSEEIRIDWGEIVDILEMIGVDDADLGFFPSTSMWLDYKAVDELLSILYQILSEMKASVLFPELNEILDEPTRDNGLIRKNKDFDN